MQTANFATDYFYKLSKVINESRKWISACIKAGKSIREYGPIDITLSIFSKPSRMIREIVAKAGAAKSQIFGKRRYCVWRMRDGGLGPSHPAESRVT